MVKNGGRGDVQHHRTPFVRIHRTAQASVNDITYKRGKQVFYWKSLASGIQQVSGKVYVPKNNLFECTNSDFELQFRSNMKMTKTGTAGTRVPR